ncbi:alpha-1,2-fucosyltransferase [Methanococcoides sp. SA1]|nr:alpha-1,2-fucosyltransferase [Methanococcoides sp. SA1]
MIIVEVGRGLGNSMYVYAAGKALAEHHETELKIDTSYLDAWPQPNRKFGGSWDTVIDRFNISAKRATRDDVKRFLFRTWLRPFDRLIYRFKLFEKNVVRYPTNGSIKGFLAIPDNTYLVGYFGEDKFFKNIKDIIQNEFTLKEKFKTEIKELLEEISSVNSISMHIRRGDVLKLKDCYVLDVGYYKNAITEIKKKIKNPVFYVFSDEIDWCKKNLGKLGVRLKFVEGYRDYEDLELMKSCKHNILANSSFSWWGGYLNKNAKKIVIAPKKFTMFKHEKGANLPRDWVLIE